jgi:uncharacterized membrane protein
MMKFSISIFLVLLTATVFGQQVELKGQVLDSEFNNEPLAFAEVKVQGLDLVAISDENGNYTLALTPGTYTLEVEFIGYETELISDVELNQGGAKMEPVVLKSRRFREDSSVAFTEEEVEPSKQ